MWEYKIDYSAIVENSNCDSTVMLMENNEEAVYKIGLQSFTPLIEK